ncbi:23603_t:CDS:2, partial [Gigaspora rosea]
DGDDDGRSYIEDTSFINDNQKGILADNTLHQYLGITQHPETKKYRGLLGDKLKKLIKRTEKGEIQFQESESTNILQPKINDQEVYSSRLLNSLISKALALQST